MEYVNLGSTGLKVSRVCLGMMSYGKHREREWALDREQAEPIVRATKLEHLKDALAATSLSLSPEQIAKLEELYRPHAVTGM